MPPRHNPRPYNPHHPHGPQPDAQHRTPAPTLVGQSTVPSPPVRLTRSQGSRPQGIRPQGIRPQNRPAPSRRRSAQPMQPMQNAPQTLPPRTAPKPNRRAWWLIPLVGLVGFFSVTLVAVLIAVTALYSGGILPNVRAAGIAVGGMSADEAADALASKWTTLTLTDRTTGEVWTIDPQRVGIALDANATASRAYEKGRTDGSALIALRGVDVPPVLVIDPEAARAGFEELRTDLDKPAQDAGIEVIAGEVREKPSQSGRVLDIDATLAQLQTNGSDLLADGRFEIIRVTTQPQVTDAAPLVEAARQLLSQPIHIRVFDPVTGDIITWDAQPETWATWLTMNADPDSPTGLALSVNRGPVRDYLDANAAVLDDTRYLDDEKAVAEIEKAIQRGDLQATVRVYHHDRQHTVQAGETIISIAWDYGVPYPWIQDANPGVDALSIGQTLTIPSQDNFFQFDPVPDKRIVVSISQQKTWVYENGALKWEWGSSTGINSSPTWPGIYQIISHEPNAYAANWDLWMPNFMGVYQPIPGQNFTNGFHGFPTRGGGQLLWENSIGTKVTYGCILLNNTNIQTLYNWAENGVVVEIQA